MSRRKAGSWSPVRDVIELFKKQIYPREASCTDVSEIANLALERARYVKFFVTSNDAHVIRGIAKALQMTTGSLLDLARKYVEEFEKAGCVKIINSFGSPLAFFKFIAYERDRSGGESRVDVDLDEMMLAVLGVFFSKIGRVEDYGIYLIDPHAESPIYIKNFNNLRTFFASIMKKEMPTSTKIIFLSAYVAQMNYNIAEVGEMLIQERERRAQLFSYVIHRLTNYVNYLKRRGVSKTIVNIARYYGKSDKLDSIFDLFAQRLVMHIEIYSEFDYSSFLYDAVREIRQVVDLPPENVPGEYINLLSELLR